MSKDGKTIQEIVKEMNRLQSLFCLTVKARDAKTGEVSYHSSWTNQNAKRRHEKLEQRYRDKLTEERI